MLSTLLIARVAKASSPPWIQFSSRTFSFSTLSRLTISSSSSSKLPRLGRRYFSTPPPASSSSTPPPASTPTTSTLFGKGVALIKEYGAVGLGVYFTLWAVPFATSFVLFDLNNNFGQDPVMWVEYFAGKENRIKLWARMGMKPDDNLSPRVISLLLAYLVCEVIETPRIAATVFLTPVAKRYLVSSSAAKAASILSIVKTSETNNEENTRQVEQEEVEKQRRCIT